MKRLFFMVLTAIIIVSLLGNESFAVNQQWKFIVYPNENASIDWTHESAKVLWQEVSGAKKYQISLRRLDPDKKLFIDRLNCGRSLEFNLYDYLTNKHENITSGQYRLWVGAIGPNNSDYGGLTILINIYVSNVNEKKYNYYNYNGLNILRTKASNVSLLKNSGSVANSGRVAINGGYFVCPASKNKSALTTISVVNDIPLYTYKDYKNGRVCDTSIPNSNYSGWVNVDGKRGTIVYDGETKTVNLQYVSNADEISVSDRSNYWAIGGASMNLSYDENTWLPDIAYASDGYNRRTGIFYDAYGYLYLIVTNNKTTMTANGFRDCIRQYIHDYSIGLDGSAGIFLDGNGSSQMNCAEVSIKGDSRFVPSILSIK